VGEVSARDLARNFVDLDALAKASAEDVQQIDGIGPSVAESVADWFSLPYNKLVLKKLKAAGVWPKGGGKRQEAGRRIQWVDFRHHRHITPPSRVMMPKRSSNRTAAR
jgi:NAD-dependent DNA ligase